MTTSQMESSEMQATQEKVEASIPNEAPNDEDDTKEKPPEKPGETQQSAAQQKISFLQFASSDGTPNLHHRFHFTYSEPPNLLENEVTLPIKQGRFEKTSIGKDGNGFFVCNSEVRTHSFKTVDEIPEHTIKQIQLTKAMGYS